MKPGAIFYLRTCERCGRKFRQRFGRGRPRKYDTRCAAIVKRESDDAAKKPKRRFGSREAFWAWQRSPERRRELSQKLRALSSAVRGVGQSARRFGNSVVDELEELGFGGVP